MDLPNPTHESLRRLNPRPPVVILPDDLGSVNESHSMHAAQSDPDQGKEEARLIELARAGDAEAFGALCEPLEGRLLRQALALCGQPATAEDLAQETLIAAWKGIRTFRGHCRLFTWLCGILIRLHLRSRRQRNSRPDHAAPGAFHREEIGPLDSVVHPDRSPAERLEWEEREALFRQCLDRLPPKQRQVIYLRFYVDHSLEAIALALGCSLGTVKSRLFHALKKLSQMPELNRRIHP